MRSVGILGACRDRRRSGSSLAGGDEAVRDEIAGLSGLGLGELRARWEQAVGRPAPRGLQREFLTRALAHEMQVRAFGGLTVAVKRRLRELAKAAREDRFDDVLGSSSVKPGTLLVRVWQGETHRVMVASDGFIWNGNRCGSLSTIAKTITGTSWNGWTFFGVKRPAGRNKNAKRSKGEAASSNAFVNAASTGVELAFSDQRRVMHESTDA